jgi:hypothetical protein
MRGALLIRTWSHLAQRRRLTARNPDTVRALPASHEKAACMVKANIAN